MSQGELGRGLCISWQSWCIHTGTWQKRNHVNSLTTIHCLNMAIFCFKFAIFFNLIPSDKLLQKLDWRKCCVVRCWLLLWVSSYKQIYKVSKSMFVFWKYVVSHFFSFVLLSEEWSLRDSSLLAEIEFCIWCHLLQVSL